MELSNNKGEINYELSNHLGNVLAVVSNRRVNIASGGTISSYKANLISSSDYYPFGMQMPGRNFSSDKYRYGFQGQEKDDEIKGSGNSYDFGARLYDSRLGRWLAVDPLAAKYPSLSAYSFVRNCPILCYDPDGKVIVTSFTTKNNKGVKVELGIHGNRGGKDVVVKVLNKDQISEELYELIMSMSRTEVGLKESRRAHISKGEVMLEKSDDIAVGEMKKGEYGIIGGRVVPVDQDNDGLLTENDLVEEGKTAVRIGHEINPPNFIQKIINLFTTKRTYKQSTIIVYTGSFKLGKNYLGTKANTKLSEVTIDGEKISTLTNVLFQPFPIISISLLFLILYQNICLIE